jgi:hypothetical protein
MTVYDRMHDQKVKVSLSLLTYKADVTGQAVVDTNGYKAAVIYVVSGAEPGGDTGSSYPIALMGSADGSTGWTAITTANGLINSNITVDGSQTLSAPGTVATIATQSQTVLHADAAGVRRFGYVGPFRYLRIDIASSSGTLTTGRIHGGFVELLEPDVKPVFQD